LEFVQVPDGPDPVYHFAFNIPENKLPAAQDWLAPRCPIVSRPDGTTLVYDFRRINAHAFYFLDPSGNILEFIARHNLKNAASGAFSTKDILYASEIGLVVPDVPRAVEDLHARLGLSTVSDPTPVFTMVGDEHGMFIVVKAGRIWLGSHVPAAPFSTEVFMRGSEPARIALPDAPFHVELKK
jgi:catechol-2,3-dioxygenase